MFSMVGWSRRQTARVVALALLLSMFLLGQLPSVSDDALARTAAKYDFSPLALALPAGLPQQTMRPVNQDFERIPAWVSSVGAGVAMGDLTGDGLANDICLSDPRSDEVIVTPAPVAGADRYAPFVLDAGELPIDVTMAPMGCVPGDFNADGRTDILVYYWGRTPIIFLAKENATELDADAFHAVEMVDDVSSDGEYHGPLWNTNAVAVSDLDGDGYPEIVVGNYWPHGPVLDETVSGGVAMPRSLSYALNGGESYIYRWTAGSAGDQPSVSYRLAADALPEEARNGWTLAAAAVDLDGDQLPELLLVHDFGPDRLMHNQSTPGEIRFESVRGDRAPTVPRSKIVGRSSFKGMGADFGDLSGDGSWDFFISNITTSWGIHESNLAFINTAADEEDMRAQLLDGGAPFEDRSATLGMAWTGWGWDVKLADLNNNGNVEVFQTTGFIRGKVNRWAQLQEMATVNDELVANPELWPHVRDGDDLAGRQPPAFFAKTDSGRFVNLSESLGLAVPIPTRGVAFGDATGDGRLDIAVARQWEEPIFYRNDSPGDRSFLGLRLLHESAEADAGEAAGLYAGSPVVDAQVRVTTVDGDTFIGRVDGGSGHAGKRSQYVHIGLGEVTGPLSVTITWRDRTGEPREQVVELEPGWHELHLGERVVEETA